MRWTRNAVVFAEKVRRAKFSRVCGWKVFSSIWCAKVRFVAGVIGLGKSELDELQRPVVRECLSSSGFNRRFPRKVVFGPALYGGMEWDDAHTLKCVEQIKNRDWKRTKKYLIRYINYLRN